MTKIRFDKRLICDIDFYQKNLKYKYEYMRWLMFINQNSKEYPRNHVMISLQDFKLILKSNPNLSSKQDILKAALKEIDEPKAYEKEKNEITRNILYAIYLSTFTPFNTYILTIDDKLALYKQNPHYKNMRKGVFAVADREALQIIKTLYEDCLGKEKY